MRGSTFRIAGWLAVAGLLGAAVLAPSVALATKPAPGHTVTICHATSSDHNPYVRETVDIASSGYLKGGHSDHTGPVWDSSLKAHHVKWGDIIPPYAYLEFAFAGLNWTADGQAIWNNDCAVTRPSESPTGSPQAEESSSPSPSASESTGPTGSVEGLTGGPETTIPPTDAAGVDLSDATSGWSLLLVALGGLAVSALLSPVLARRRR